MTKEITLEEMIAYCAKKKTGKQYNLNKKVLEQNNPPVKKLPSRRSMKRSVPQCIRKAIIEIAFNSDTEFDHLRHHPVAIAKIFNLHRNTVRSII